MSESALAQAVLDHVEAGTTDRGEACWREPVQHYLSADRFEKELAALRAQPVVFCPSAALTQPGGYVVRDTLGISVVAVRGADGRVRAFRNVCRHRGMAVAQGAGCVKALVCRYHGWTYGRDGSLRHVPHADGFPDVNRAERRLVELAAGEEHGLVTVALDGPSAGAEGFDEIAGLLGPQLTLVDVREQVEPANWKILTETFLEGLHIRFLHHETFFPLQFDNLNVVERFGPHSRVTFPYRNVTKLAALPPEQRTVDGKVTLVHHLFPTALVATFPDLRMLFTIDPLAPDQTRIVTYTFTFVDRQSARHGSTATGDRPLLRNGGAEDFAAARSVQRGLASGANQFLEFGLFEPAIAHFHQQLDRIVELH